MIADALRVAIPCNGVKMIGRRVPFVAVEPVSGIPIVQFPHLPVPGHLGHNRGGGNGRAAPVAVRDAALSHGQIRNTERVNQDDIGERRNARMARCIARRDAW